LPLSDWRDIIVFELSGFSCHVETFDSADIHPMQNTPGSGSGRATHALIGRILFRTASGCQLICIGDNHLSLIRSSLCGFVPSHRGPRRRIVNHQSSLVNSGAADR
jgi:hypothetical protein